MVSFQSGGTSQNTAESGMGTRQSTFAQCPVVESVDASPSNTKDSDD
jgi:hypothetical protein